MFCDKNTIFVIVLFYLKINSFFTNQFVLFHIICNPRKSQEIQGNLRKSQEILGLGLGLPCKSVSLGLGLGLVRIINLSLRLSA